MTREEAVLLLIAAEEKLLDGFYKGEFYVEEGMGKAFEMAIEALSYPKSTQGKEL